MRWFDRETIPIHLLQEYLDNKNPNAKNSCNVDKTTTFSCDFKVKTCGILLACSNCGIILNYKEFYGAESCKQVGLFYLETSNNFKG